MLLSSKNDETDGNKTFEVYSSYITVASNIFKQTKTQLCVMVYIVHSQIIGEDPVAASRSCAKDTFKCTSRWVRAGLSCNMSSLMLKECKSFAKENNSKLFVCFLNVQKAFDCVWHNGLFVNLYEMGIRSNLLRIIINMHSGMKRSVFYSGHHSD